MAILVSFVPIATAIIARIVLKDRSLSIPLVVGSLIAICGVAVVSVGSTIELQVRPLGDLMALIAMLSWGFYSILVDIVNARGVAPITAMRKSFAWSLVIMAPFALWGATECGAHSLDGVFGVTLAVEENAARFSSVGNWANFEATGGYRVRHGYHSKLPQVRQAKLGRTNSGRSYIVKKSTYD